MSWRAPKISKKILKPRLFVSNSDYPQRKFANKASAVHVRRTLMGRQPFWC